MQRKRKRKRKRKGVLFPTETEEDEEPEEEDVEEEGKKTRLSPSRLHRLSSWRMKADSPLRLNLRFRGNSGKRNRELTLRKKCVIEFQVKFL